MEFNGHDLTAVGVACTQYGTYLNSSAYNNPHTWQLGWSYPPHVGMWRANGLHNVMSINTTTNVCCGEWSHRG